MPARRALHFQYLEDILTDVHRLAATPHDRAGQWNLAQISTHLAMAFELSMDGFDQPAPRLPRRLLGKLILPYILYTRRIPAGRPLAQKHVPPADINSASALARLHEAINRFHATARLHAALDHLETVPTPLAPHPYFGPLSAKKWTAFHLVHAAHHLSFLIPGQP